jgi:flavin reductase ActVB
LAESTLDPQNFKDAMAAFPSGVTIVTTVAPDGTPVGFTASAFSSLSLDPPLVLICLDRKAECYDAFDRAKTFAVSILARGQGDTAMKFATRGADKFGGAPIERGAVTGNALIKGAIAQLECTMYAKPDGGDHVILVGKVVRASTTAVEPLMFYSRKFGHFEAD